MITTLEPELPFAKRVMPRTLETFRVRGGMDMAFGAQVLRGASALEITEFCGTRTRSVANLAVRSGAGVGGKALSLGRPVSVTSYLAAQGITHAYDHAVRPEAIETVAVLPVIVEGQPRWGIYLCNRTQVGLGDRWFDSLAPLIRKLEREIAVDDEVRRRLAMFRASVPAPADNGLTRDELRDIAAELGDLASQIQDATLRAKMEAMRDRFAPKPPSAAATGSVSPLAPREVDVLEAVARGLSNAEIGEALGLLPNTVKSYLKTAMRKLHAANRVQATLVAREAGLIR
ncbi:helix-turn-helix transcriptional regulator [Nocardioides zeicaulis]|uniref:Response regulator transcription factor n=1 Tax=Nocardioides zeicaulis TaxID=1776857 RepID=A0ABV6DWQ1_9ACTN